jgi:hypothetical protein
VFAPNSKYRAKVSPARRGKHKISYSAHEADQSAAEKRASMSRAKRLKRVLAYPRAPSLVAAHQFTLLRLKPVVNATVKIGSLPVLKIQPEIGRAEGDEQQPILISDIYLT